MMTRTLVLTGALLVVFATGVFVSSGVEGGFPERLLLLEPLKKADGLAPRERALERVSGVIVPNLGQANAGVYYQLLLSEVAASLRQDGIGIYSRDRASREASRVNFQFIGSNTKSRIRVTGLSSQRLKYKVGSISSRSSVTIPLFSEVTYTNLYDGVDLSLAVSKSTVTRRFTLKAGQTPDRLLFRYEGAEDPVFLPSGELLLGKTGGMVTYARPTAFQIVDGDQVPVPVAYKLGRYGAFGFSVGAHNASLPLVIQLEGV